MLHRPELAAFVERGALDVAVTIRPDLGARAGRARRRGCRADRAVGIDAHDLADRDREVLGAVHAARTDRPASRRASRPDGTRAASPSGCSRSPWVPGARSPACCRARGRRGALGRPPCPLHPVPVRRTTGTRAGPAQSRGLSATSSSPPCPCASTTGTPVSALERRPPPIDDAQPTRPLGDEHAAVGQERQAPRMLAGRARPR